MVVIKQNNTKKIVNVVLLFLYVYNIAFSILPIFFRTRILIGLYGFVRDIYGKCKINSIIFNIIILNFLILIPVLITGIITGNFGLWFVQHAVLNIIYLFGAGFIAHRFAYEQYKNVYSILYLLLCVIIFHNVIAFIGFLYRPLGDIFLIIQKVESGGGAFDAITTFRSRVFGLGVGSFFIGGIISGLGIIIDLFLIQKKHLTIKKGTILFIILLGTGLFIARTTMIGLVGVLIFCKPSEFTRALRILFISICIGGGIALLMINFLKEYLPIDWAFELFINFFTSDNLETSSTNELSEMWKLPQNPVTWIFGDGLFFYPDGSYYMYTDVGYLRIIYCIGLVGLIVLIINQLYLMYSLINLCIPLRPFVLILGVYILILNIKGFAEINFFYYLMIGYLISKNKQLNESKDKYYFASI